MSLGLWVALWLIAGWLIGILAYFAGPLVAGLVVCVERLNAIASHYDKVAM